MPDPNAKLLAKLREMADESEQIEAAMADPDAFTNPARLRELSIRRAAIAPSVEHFQSFTRLSDQARELRQIIAENTDADLTEMARAELPEIETRAEQVLSQAIAELVTADDRGVGSVILEIRAGTGGAEAALWAGDLLSMYQRYATRKGWEIALLDHSPGEQGGYRNAILHVQGQGVWIGMGYESGVHCVKRVPATETQGRVHTSTATVAALPEPEKVQIDIPDSDVKMDITTAQGPGGQNVNKVSTAVHLVHIPTGIEVRMQESKSQQQNRTRAWQLLRARVFDHFQSMKNAERAQTRSKLIGTAGRSERVRTYRYKESIVVDHRIEATFPLQNILDGQLEPMIEALARLDQEQRIAAL